MNDWIDDLYDLLAAGEAAVVVSVVAVRSVPIDRLAASEAPLSLVFERTTGAFSYSGPGFAASDHVKKSAFYGQQHGG